METKTETLNFYTEGAAFTNLLRTFIEEGRNFTVYQVLRDGGFTETLANQFIRGELKFTGTTQLGGDLGVEEDSFDSSNMLKQSIRSILSKYEWDEDTETYTDFSKLLNRHINDSDIRILVNAFGKDALFEFYRTDVLNDYTISLITDAGYGFFLADSIRSWYGDYLDGVILPSGDFISCGYQEHSSLYPFLCDLGLVKVRCWTDCETTIHVSSGQIGGAISHEIGSRYTRSNVTEEQLQTLFKLRHNLRNYGYDDNISSKLLKDINATENFGGKWNNLSYIKKYYPKIQLPKFSKEPIEGVKNCLRTSPKYSLPGLLESVFDIKENSVQEIQATYEKHKNVRPGNELHVFYQEYIEGSNGVFHYDEEGFRYDISENRGDIVQGKIGNAHISETAIRKLKSLGELFYKDFENPIQVEFVIKGDDVWVVQLRILDNNAERTVRLSVPDEYLGIGKTFSKGSIEVDVDKILVIESDCDSEQILDKEALIVKNNVEFSHILALSKALRIPSIYGTGDIELPTEGKVKFVAYNEQGWILKYNQDA